MAVPFYIPEQNEGGDGSNISNQYPNTTSSATQTPLPSPIGREHLVQAFYDALYRCSINGSPNLTQGQSCNTPLFVYDQREIFLHNNNGNFISNNIINEDLQQNSPFIQNSSPSPWNPNLFRSEVDERFEHYMLEREKLEEFSGRLPIRKRRKDKLRSKCVKFENLFKWSTVVTIAVIAIGCGLLVSR